MSKNFGLNLSKFKKIKQEGNFTTLRHADGHELRIAHKSLSKQLRSQLDALPSHEQSMAKGGSIQKLAEGNEVQAAKKDFTDIDMAKLPTEPITDIDMAKLPTEPITDIDMAKLPAAAAPAQVPAAQSVDILQPGMDKQVEDFVTKVPAASSAAIDYKKLGVPETAPAAPVAPPVAEQNPLASSAAATSEALASGTQAQLAGTVLGAAGEAKKLKAEAQAAAAGAQRQEMLKMDFAEQMKQLDANMKNWGQHVIENPIDSNRYLHSLDTGGKISTVIGLILGGLGGGGKVNLALDALNKQIDRDLDVQKKNLGRYENLLSTNLQHYGNITTAQQVTSMMMKDIIANNILAQASKYGDPMIMGRAQAAIGALMADRSQVLGQAAMRQALFSGHAKGQIPAGPIIEMYIPANDRPAARQQYQDAIDHIRARDLMLSSFDDIVAANTVAGRITKPIQTAYLVAALQKPLEAQLGKDIAGRYTKQDADALASLFPGVLTDEETVSRLRQQLVRVITQKAFPDRFVTLDTYGINPMRREVGRFDEQGQDRLAGRSVPHVAK